MNLSSKLTLIGLLVLIAALTACTGAGGFRDPNLIVGSGTAATETREVSAFNGINVSGSGELIITQGDAVSLEIIADDNILPVLTSDINNEGILDLGAREGTSISPVTNIVYRVTVTDLTSIETSGGIQVTFTNAFISENMRFVSSGESTVSSSTFNVNVVSIETSGNATYTLAGEGNTLSLSTSGLSVFNGRDFVVESATLDMSGEASSTVNATDTLNIEISGEAIVRYVGNPAITRDVSGEAQILPME